MFKIQIQINKRNLFATLYNIKLIENIWDLDTFDKIIT
jgi:hypothetical protein